MKVHQVVVSAAPGDAVTSAALELQAAFRAIGPSGLYARYIHASLEDRFEFLEDLEAQRQSDAHDDVIVFHVSIGEPPVFAFIRDAPERLVVNYHNISPPDPFLSYAPEFARLLEQGRRETAALADRAVLALADSAYNARELEAMGYARVEVAPPVVDIYRLEAEAASAELDRRVGTVTDGPVVLYVGQQLPHKRPDYLVQMFHLLSTYLDPSAALVMVGAARLPSYAKAVEQEVAELNLDSVVMAGMVEDATLAAWYRRADVFATASEHEGFCMPIVEAMAFGVPVVARGFAAVPETVSGAGVIVPPDASPAVFAEAVARVIRDDRLRPALVDAGRRRVREFAPARARATIVTHLLAAVGSGG